jgi:putative membrane protein
MLLLLPGVALAHGGETHALRLSEVLGWWTVNPWVMGTLALSALLYARGLQVLWRRAGRGHGVRGWEAGMFALGLLCVAIALLSPLDRLSDLLFSAHMGQHEILMLVAAPLLVLGKPFLLYLWALPAPAREWVGARFAQPGVGGAWRALTHPLVVLLLHGLARWMWHAPFLFEAALRSEWVHGLQHALFFSTAALFWWALVHGRYGRVGYGVAVLFVFVTAVHTGVLGAMLTFGRSLWYPLYAQRGAEWGVDALQDQHLAGLLMWVPAGTLFLVIGLALFAAWLGESERRERAGHVDMPGGRERGA